MRVRSILLVAQLLASAGCTTIYSEEQAETEAQRDLTVQNLRAQVGQLQETVNDMQAQREDLYRRMEQLEADVQLAQKGQKDRLAALEHGVTSLDQERRRDREEIVSKVADLVKTSSGGGARVAEGYEHIVKAGETLSAIAAAYKVSPAAIIKANTLKNPDSLRVGQKLFIPE